MSRVSGQSSRLSARVTAGPVPPDVPLELGHPQHLSLGLSAVWSPRVPEVCRCDGKAGSPGAAGGGQSLPSRGRGKGHTSPSQVWGHRQGCCREAWLPVAAKGCVGTARVWVTVWGTALVSGHEVCGLPQRDFPSYSTFFEHFFSVSPLFWRFSFFFFFPFILE